MWLYYGHTFAIGRSIFRYREAAAATANHYQIKMLLVHLCSSIHYLPANSCNIYCLFGEGPGTGPLID
jgi:hypothetical protein